MRRDWLLVLGLGLALAASIVVLFGLLTDGIAPAIVRTVAWGNAIFAVLLFVAVVFDRKVHKAVERANRAMQQGRPFKFRWISWSDEDWGVFGDRWGSLPLAIFRFVLFVEFVVVLILRGQSDLLLVAASGFVTSILLTMRQLPAQPEE